jgi:hypothetical protein
MEPRHCNGNTVRPQHKTAHRPCPYGQTNWADCDVANSHRFGQCRAMVDDKPEPHQCTRWAQDEEGWCGQHYASETQRIKDAQKAALKAEEFERRYLEHEAMVASDPWWWLALLVPSAESTVGLSSYGKTAKNGMDRRQRGRPYRLPEPW